MLKKHIRLDVLLALFLVSNSLAVLARDKDQPITQFDLTLTYAIEQDLPSANPLDMAVPDPTQSFLRDQLGLSEAKINQVNIDAEEFFLERFGLDFRNVPADANGIRLIDGAMLFPYQFANNVDYRVISASDKAIKKPLRINDGGFIVMTTGPITYHGTFGGVEGKAGFPGEMLPYAFYKINGLSDGRHHKPLVISARAAGPMRTNVDGDTSINCEVNHPTLGRGNAEGVFKFVPNPDGSMHIGARNVLTFPGR